MILKSLFFSYMSELEGESLSKIDILMTWQEALAHYLKLI